MGVAMKDVFTAERLSVWFIAALAVDAERPEGFVKRIQQGAPFTDMN